MEQSIFDLMYPKYQITKPIRLIEMFGGMGSQYNALKRIGVDVEHYKLIEWAVNSIQAYNDIHCQDYTDYGKDMSKEELIEYLANKGVSINYNQPMTLDQLKRKSIEWLKTVYNNIIATKNLVNIQQVKGKDLNIVDKDKYEYIVTYSFPCQDLSLAGLGKGMSKGSGTRSGMLWEVERILDECEELPQILLMENVPQVIGTGNVEHFNKWQLKLEQLGYKNYHQNLIATDYGIPQTRNRTFMISILGDYSYTFPQPIPLKLKLKDMLENDVDEKYFLSEKQIESLENGVFNASKPSVKLGITDNGLCQTLDTMSGGNRQPLVRVKRIGNTNPSGNGMNGNVFDSEGLSPTLTTNKGEGLKIATTICLNSKVNGKQPSLQDRIYDTNGMSTTLTTSFLPSIAIPEATKKGYALASDGDSINLEQPNSKTRRGRVGKGVAQTLMTNPQQATVVNKINKVDIPQKVRKRKYEVNIDKLKETLIIHKNITNKEIANKLNKPVTEVEHWFRKDNSFSIPDENIWLELKEILKIDTNEFDEAITIFIEEDGVFEKGNRVYLDNGIAPTLTCASANERIMTNLIIRKLTPRECFRLMGFSDIDFDNASKHLSDSALYHLAGDSIVVEVLVAIFKELIK